MVPSSVSIKSGILFPQPLASMVIKSQTLHAYHVYCQDGSFSVILVNNSLFRSILPHLFEDDLNPARGARIDLYGLIDTNSFNLSSTAQSELHAIFVDNVEVLSNYIPIPNHVQRLQQMAQAQLSFSSNPQSPLLSSCPTQSESEGILSLPESDKENQAPGASESEDESSDDQQHTAESPVATVSPNSPVASEGEDEPSTAADQQHTTESPAASEGKDESSIAADQQHTIESPVATVSPNSPAASEGEHEHHPDYDHLAEHESAYEYNNKPTDTDADTETITIDIADIIATSTVTTDTDVETITTETVTKDVTKDVTTDTDVETIITDNTATVTTTPFFPHPISDILPVPSPTIVKVSRIPQATVVIEKPRLIRPSPLAHEILHEEEEEVEVKTTKVVKAPSVNKRKKEPTRRSLRIAKLQDDKKTMEHKKTIEHKKPAPIRRSARISNKKMRYQ